MTTKKTSTKGDKTREQILSVALELFKEHGFEATTIRNIAQKASIAVGATHYYFKNKNEIVSAFYESTQSNTEIFAQELIRKTTNFEERISKLVEYKLEQLSEYRNFLGQLTTISFQTNNPASPFSSESKEVRTSAILIFEQLITGSDLKISSEFSPFLPKLFWLYMMGVIFYWLNDCSKNTIRTKQLLAISLKLILNLIALTRLPLVRKLNKNIVALLELFPMMNQALILEK